jgi:tetratricopeptide (TPR) repeat protein
MKVMLSLTLIAGATLAAAAPAQAAVRVVGGTSAQACYLAAKAERASRDGLAACEQALANEPLSRRDRAGTNVNRGILRMYERDYASALADYDTAVELEPQLAEAYVNRGIALLRLRGQPAAEEASAAFTRGLQLETNKPEVAHYMRAVASEMLGDARGAYLDYRRASELAPAWGDPRSQLQRFKVVAKR